MALDPYIKTVMTIPSAQLVSQTAEEYENVPWLKSCAILSKDSKKKRLKKIKENRHIIITRGLFRNMIDDFKDDMYAIFIDECHIFGESTEEIVHFDVPHWPIRVGLTGTMPDDLYKKERIICCLGNGVLQYTKNKELISHGYSSKPYIKMVQIVHKEIEDIFSELDAERKFDWSIEQNYYETNQQRIQSVAEWIEGIMENDPKNTLVLCHAATGNKIAEQLGIGCIDKNTPVKTRRETFHKFRESDSELLLASFGTSSTGISENDILRMVLVDVGKNKTTVLQSIGRGLRLDGNKNQLEIWDLSSNTKYARQHRSKRRGLYKKEEFEFSEKYAQIYVSNNTGDMFNI